MDENMLDVIRKRRTIRRFTKKDVSGEQVETLLEIAMCAPNRLIVNHGTLSSSATRSYRSNWLIFCAFTLTLRRPLS